jgi:hypothetical protein
VSFNPVYVLPTIKAGFARGISIFKTPRVNNNHAGMLVSPVGLTNLSDHCG